MIEELFAPGRKHTDEERKRLELSRVDLYDGDPGRGPIDLDSGRAVIRRSDREAIPEREATPDPQLSLEREATPDRDVA